MLLPVALLLLGQLPAVTALSGNDPVRLCEGEAVEGKSALAVEHGPFRYRFESEATRERFLADPERWSIQWGGRCARMGPLSGEGSPERWTVHRGRIYVFASDGCRTGFLTAPDLFVVPPPTPPEFTPEQLASGIGWIARAVEVHGGQAFLRPTRTLKFERETEVDGWRVKAERWIAPDLSLRTSTTYTSIEGEVERTVWGLTDDAAWVEENGGPQEITSPQQRHDLRRIALREPLALLLARTRPDYRAAYLGDGTLGETPVADVLVRVAGLSTLVHLDQKTGEILGLSWTGRLDDGRTREVTEVIADWTEVEGKRVPIRRIVTTRDGVASEMAHDSAALLEEVTASLFRVEK